MLFVDAFDAFGLISQCWMVLNGAFSPLVCSSKKRGNGGSHISERMVDVVRDQCSMRRFGPLV